MKLQTLFEGLCLTLAFGLVATVAEAQGTRITIEPDNYVGVIGIVAPGAKLSTFRRNSTFNGYAFEPVRSVNVGSLAPTGSRVFGKKPQSAAEPNFHWNDLGSAFLCESMGFCFTDNFYVFRVDFEMPTSRASVLTTLADAMLDGMELHAYDRWGSRILQCRLEGWMPSIETTGVVDPPRYIVPPPGIGARCGGVVSKRNCGVVGPLPGGCEYSVKLEVFRRAGDISYIGFGGGYANGTYAVADELQYVLP